MRNPRKRELLFVCISVFLLIFGTYISGTLLVPYAMSLGGTGIIIGIVYSSMYVVRLVLGTPIGRLSQRKGSKTVLTYSLALYPFIALAYWISWNVPSLVVARLLHGVASAMMLPMAMAYLGECSPKGKEGRYISIYNTLLFTASAFGPITGGIIFDHFGVRPAFAALFGLAAAALLLILMIRDGGKNTDADQNDNAGPEAALPKLTMKWLLCSSSLLALGFMNIGTAVLLALFGASFTQFALLRHIGMGEIGAIVALMNIVIGVGQIPFGRLADRWKGRNPIILSAVMAVLLTACIPVAGNIVSVGILVLFDSVFISLNIALTSALATRVGREAGMSNTMGFLGTANSGGTILGYLLLGFVSDAISVNAPFYFTAALFFIGTALFLFVGGKRPNTYQVEIPNIK